MDSPKEWLTEDRDDRTSDDVDMPEHMRQIGYDVQVVEVEQDKLFFVPYLSPGAVGWARMHLKISSFRIVTGRRLHAYLAAQTKDWHASPAARVMDDRLVKNDIERGLMKKPKPKEQQPKPTDAEAERADPADDEEPPAAVGEVHQLGDYLSRRQD